MWKSAEKAEARKQKAQKAEKKLTTYGLQSASLMTENEEKDLTQRAQRKKRRGRREEFRKKKEKA